MFKKIQPAVFVLSLILVSLFSVLLITPAHAAPDEATLWDLAIDGVSIDGFASEDFEYTVNVDWDTTEIDISAVASDAGATISGDIGSQSLAVGNNDFTITVVSQDTMYTEDYLLHVIKAVPDARLSDIKINEASIAGFDPDSSDITVNVDWTKSRVYIEYITMESNAHCSTRDGYKDLQIGANDIEIVVTAEDGVTQKTYHLHIIREDDTSPIVSFNCPNLKQELIEDNIDKNSDGELSENEMLLLGSTFSAIEKGITDLTGLKYAKNLLVVHLHYNDITTIKSDTFEGMTKLYEVNLYYNDIATIEPGAFSGLSSLRTVHLYGNQITALNDNMFSDSPNLGTLTLRYNNINSISDNAFNGMTGLYNLDLRTNQLTAFNTTAFSKLTGLQKLYLSGNPLGTIQSNAFNWPSNIIDQLYLIGCSITEIQDDGFLGLSNLTILDLTDNSINSLETADFNGLTSLEELTLRTNTGFTELTQNTFSALTSLETLYIEDCDLATIHPYAFNGMSSLTSLYITDCSISSLPANAFNGLNNLSYLSLNANDISTIGVDSFAGLPSVTELVLTNNNLSAINANSFQGLTSIEKLYLNRNNFSTLQSGYFEGLASLKELNLTENTISTIGVDAFSGLDSIETLNISYNQASSIQSGAFNGLSTLTNLYLEGNGITQLSDISFTGAESVTSIRLADNQIKEVPAGALDSLPNLFDFSIFSNSLTTIDSEVFTSHPRLGRIWITGNYLNLAGDDGVELDEIEASGINLFLGDDQYTYVFTLDYNGGDGEAIGKEYYYFEETVNIPAGSKPNNNFLGWDSNNDGTVDYAAGDYIITADPPINHPPFVDLVAVYEPMEDCATLSTITIDGTEIDDFNYEKEGYLIFVDENKASILLEAVPTDSSAALTGDVGNLSLNAGSNEFIIGVTARDGVTYKEYKLTIIRSSQENYIVEFDCPNLKQALIDGGYDANSDGELSAAEMADITGDLYLDDKGITDITGINYAVNVYYLNLNDNLITEINYGDFIGMNTNLLYLNIANNQIIKIDDYVFEDLYNLRSLTIGGGTLPTIKTYTFAGLTGLTSLAVTDIGLSAIEADAFLDLNSLEYLGLSGNSISSFNQNTFEYLDKLDNLDLSENSLTSLQDNAFIQMPSLEEIDLNNNMISSFNATAFAGLSSLENVDFSYNQLTSIPAGCFIGLDMDVVDFSYNSINYLNGTAFTGVININELHFENNELNSLNSAAFLQSAPIYNLYLDYNNFTALAAADFSTLHTLTLHISHNQISTIEPETFKGILNLMHLYLTGNNYSTIEAGVFENIVLGQVFICDNGIENVAANTFNGSTMDRLDLSHNDIKIVDGTSFNGAEFGRVLIQYNKVYKIAADSFAATDIGLLDVYRNYLDTTNAAGNEDRTEINKIEAAGTSVTGYGTCQRYFDLYFDGGEGTAPYSRLREVFYEETIDLPECTPPEGKRFVGWDIDGDGISDAAAGVHSFVPAVIEYDKNTGFLIDDIEYTAVYEKLPISDIDIHFDKVLLEYNQEYTLQIDITPDDPINPDLVYTSSNEAVATVDSNGVVTAGSTEMGTAIITAASDDDACSDTIEIQVVAVRTTHIVITPESGQISVGNTMTIDAEVFPENATIKDVYYESLDPDIATVDEFGVVTAVSEGDARIYVKAVGGSGYDYCEITVGTPVTDVELSHETASIVGAVGDTFQLTATISPDDASNKNVTYSSNNTSVATVDNTGLVTAVSGGTATITVITADGPHTDSCAVTVTISATGVSVDDAHIDINESQSLNVVVSPSNATNQDVTYTSSDETIVSVDANGVVTGQSLGTATITVTTVDGGHIDTCTVTSGHFVESVALTPETMDMSANETYVLTTEITPSNATNQTVTYSSSNEDVATVDAIGMVWAHSVGTATITATTEDGAHTDTCEVSVVIPVESVELNADSCYMAVGDTIDLDAEITPSDATNQNVSFESSNEAVATVDADGIVTAHSVGNAVITVTTEQGSHTDTCDIRVSDELIMSSTFTVDRVNSFLAGMAIGTTVEDIVLGIDNAGAEIVILDAEGNQVTGVPISTGFTVRMIVDDEIVDELVIIIKGDINPNGALDIIDYTLVRLHILNVVNMDGFVLDAADVNNDGKIDIIDYTLIRLHILGVLPLYE